MAGGNDILARGSVSGTRGAVAAGFCLVGALCGGCVELFEDHCIINGGDFACLEDRICLTEIDSANEVSDRGDGCVDLTPNEVDEELFVHVQYGLPSRLGASDSLARDLHSVTGIFVRGVEERGSEGSCRVNEEVVRSVESEWREIDEVREYLDRRTRVRAEAAMLSEEQVGAIVRFNDAVNGWLDDCGR